MMRCIGGVEAGAATLARHVGPLGLSAKKVATDIAQATKSLKGLKCTIKLIVANRQAQVEIVPSSATLIMKCLNEPDRDRKKEKNVKHDGNITLDDVYGVARTMRARSMAKEFSGTIKEILGTCFSIGCTVDNMHPRDVQQQITDGTLVPPLK